jgi:uncharacterized integral membrane protein
MRARSVLLVLAILLVAGFAAQNWAEFTRATTLNFGVVQESAPLGLILLGLLALVTLAFVATTAAMHSRNLKETRQHNRALHAQTELAEKAEVSRFTELRQLMDTHLREMRQRDSIQHTEMEKTVRQQHGELRNQLEQMYHLLASRMGELERRIDLRRDRPERMDRVERVEPAAPSRVETVTPARTHEPVVPVHHAGRDRP